MRDPFPQVAGQGAAQLHAAGIAVDMNIGEAEARRLNAPYLMLLASAALWAWPDTGAYLLIFTILLGTGHMFLMASQQMLAVRCANARGSTSKKARSPKAIAPIAKPS